MSGKPKGIARKLAKDKTAYLDKLGVSLFGVAGTSPLTTLWIESGFTPEVIAEMERDNPFPPKMWEKAKLGMAAARENAEIKLQQMAADARAKKDFGFFEQMAALMKLEGKPSTEIADPLGAHVLMIWVSLKLFGQMGSSSQVATLLSENFPRENGYDEGQVRRLMRELGIPASA